MRRPWTDEEISTLVSMWPNASVMQIATRLHRAYGSVCTKAKQLREEGFLEAKDTQQSRSIKPDLQDFDEVKVDYCRKHNITIAELCARLQRRRPAYGGVVSAGARGQAHKITPKE